MWAEEGKIICNERSKVERPSEPRTVEEGGGSLPSRVEYTFVSLIAAKECAGHWTPQARSTFLGFLSPPGLAS